jgi:hypothetical protein
LVQANKELSALITQVPHSVINFTPQTLTTTAQELGGTQWQFDMQLLRQLEAKSDNAELQVSRDMKCDL